MGPRFLIYQNAQTFFLGKQWWDRHRMTDHILKTEYDYRSLKFCMSHRLLTSEL